MLKRIFEIALLSSLIIVPLQGKESNMQAAFIDDILGARAWGMGGAYRTIVNNASAMIWNPAGLLDIEEKRSIVVDHVELMEFYSYSYLGYAQRLDSKKTVGSGLFYSGDDIMSEFIGYLSLGIDGNAVSELVAAGYMPAGLVNIGISGKVFYASYGNKGYDPDLPDYLQGHDVSGNALGFGLDLGLKVKPTARDHFSLTFKNLLNRINWDSDNTTVTALGKYGETLPVGFTVGYVRYQDRLNITLDIDKSLYFDVEDNIHFGLEYQFLRELILRAGYAQELVTADNQRFSIGAGINLELPSLTAVTVDLAYLNFLDWEKNNSILLGVCFDL